MQRRLRCLMVVATMLTGFTASLAIASETLYAACAGCHGVNGEGQESSLVPRLAGQNASYLAEQLENFRADGRGWHPDDVQGQIMAASAKNLSDTAIEQLASYLAGMVTKKGTSKSGEAVRGKTLYADNCLACHASGGIGIASLYTPNLRILGDWYIERQLEAYRGGWRGDGSNGSTRAKSMRSIAFQLSDSDDIADITAFLHR